MGLSNLIEKVNIAMGEHVNYRAYNLRDTKILFGVPPVPIKGIDYIMAQHLESQNNLVMGLTGKGVFVSNNNKSGIIEIGLMAGSVSCAVMEVATLAGIPFPIFVNDNKSYGTSNVVATECKRIGTPQWRRSAVPGLEIFTFHTPLLVMSGGIRETE